jgi:hypothetical protein
MDVVDSADDCDVESLAMLLKLAAFQVAGVVETTTPSAWWSW